jgi:hypothetical protein
MGMPRYIKFWRRRIMNERPKNGAIIHRYSESFLGQDRKIAKGMPKKNRHVMDRNISPKVNIFGRAI